MSASNDHFADLRNAVQTLGLDLPLFAAATFIDQAGRVVLNLLAAALLGPAVFGTWVVVSLVLQYANLLSLGIGQGAGREVPRRLGAGDEAGAAAVEDAAGGGTLLTALAAAALAALLGPALLGPESSVTAVTWLALAVLLQQIFLLEQVLYRSRLRFKAASLQLAAQGIATALVGALALAADLGLEGLLIARVAIFGVAAAMAGRTLARIPKPSFNAARIRSLVAVGAPMLLAGFLVVALVTLDRWLVLALLGREATGVYGLVGLVVGSLVVLPTLVSQQFYPRLAGARGKGADARELERLARQQNALAGGLTLVAAVVIGLGTVVLVPRFLPAYVGAVAPMLTVLGGLVAFAFASANGNVLNLLDRQRTYLAVQAMSLGFDVVAAVVFVRLGLGIWGVGLAASLTLILFAGLLTARARAAVRDDPGRTKQSTTEQDTDLSRPVIVDGG